jgi:hypothetical protein
MSQALKPPTQNWRNTSWIDLFFSWIAQLPLPAWVIYLSLIALFAFLDQWLFSLDSSPDLFDSIYGALALIITFVINHWLHQVSISAFEQFQPSLKLSRKHIEKYRQKFIFANPWIALLATLLGISTFTTFWSIGMQEGMTETTRSLPLAFIYGLILFGGNSGMIMYFMFNSLRRLKLISMLHKQVADIDLFNLNPLRAFSRVSSAAAISLLLYLAITQRFGTSPENIGFQISLGILAVVVFLVPLIGLRNKISAKREEQLKLISADLGLVAKKISSAVRNEDLDVLGKLKSGQDGLSFQRNEILSIRAWPWNTGTLRGFTSAFVLPIVIWLITRLLERFI